MKFKRILCVILTLCVILSLAACGGKAKESPNEPAPAPTSAAISADGQWQGKGGCYKLERLHEGNFHDMDGTSEHIIYRNELADKLCDADGNTLYDAYVYDYTVVEDGFWCVRAVGMVNGKYDDSCYAVKLGFDGQELKRFDVSGLADSLAVVSDTVYIYDAMNKVLRVYSTDGTELGKVDLSGAQLEDFSANLRTGGDGSVWLFNALQSGMLMYPVNLSDMKLGAAFRLPDDTVSLRPGTAEHVFLLATESELSYLDPAACSMTNILYWDECGISVSELRRFIPDGDGFLCLSVTGLSRISPAKPEDIHPRTRLTLGTLFEYEGRDLAAMFNSVSNDYYVELVDYSNRGELSPDDAQMKLNTELLSGNGPDMILSYGLSSSQGTSCYADMYALIDADPELDRDDFFALKALENGGKLLIAPSRLSISTFGALPQLFGDRTGWTWDEYFDLESKLPSGGVMSSYLSADFFLQNSLELYAPHAIDWVNGTCNFDTPEFVRILEAAKRGYDPNCSAENMYFQDEVNAMIADGRMILCDAYFSDVQSFAESEKLNGRELNYVGWPTPDGSCGSVFQVSGVSINAATGNLTGCWEFAKYVMTRSYAYKPTFEKVMNEAVSSANGVDGVKLTQSQADRYRKLMESITVSVPDGSTISDIVLQEAAAMFAGDKTPEETAKLIQSKLSIYVSEHM